MKSKWTLTKEIARTTIDLYILKGYTLEELKGMVERIEYKVSMYINNMNTDDRFKLENFILTELTKREEL